MSEIVQYGGSGPAEEHEEEEEEEEEDDLCFGRKEAIYLSMEKVAMFLIYSSPALVSAGHIALNNSSYSGDYRIVLDTFDNIFQLLDQASLDLSGRKDVCTDMSDVAMGMLGFKDCKKGNLKMDGFLAVIVAFFKKHLGSTKLIATLGVSSGILAIYTTLRNFIATLLTNLLCGMHYRGTQGFIGTWVIAKIIIKTIAKFGYENGVLSKNVAVAFGGALLGHITSIGNWSAKAREFQVKNDAPGLRDIENNINNIDNNVVNVTGIADAIDDLENLQDHGGGDKLINDYINYGTLEEDFKNNKKLIAMMQTYLHNALDDTEPGSFDNAEHNELLQSVKNFSFRWRKPSTMFDMGPQEDYADSEPIPRDTEFDKYGYTDGQLRRGNSLGYDRVTNKTPFEFGGIVKKKHKLIKNGSKAMKIMKKEYKSIQKSESKSKSIKKSKKAGWMYNIKKGTKKQRHKQDNKHHRANAGKKTKGRGKGPGVNKSKTKRMRSKRNWG
tara:strand:+ start:142 stop:1632 length:1491 start_codon:yes stop_codon:yes gene_type:complete